jgi:photosystem II stability/assembly factor-like uncharacterized protein
MDPDEIRAEMRRVLDDRFVPSPGLEARVLLALPAAPARPGGRVRPARWHLIPASAIAVVLIVLMTGSVVLWRAGALPAGLGSGQGSDVALTLGQFTSGDSGWLITRDIFAKNPSAVVYRTDDAGAHWRQQLSLYGADPQLRASADGRRAVVWGVSMFGDAGPDAYCTGAGKGSPACAGPPPEELRVYRTEDGGAHWTGMDPVQHVGDVYFLDPDHGWYLSSPMGQRQSQGLDTYRTDDGGRTWTKLGVLDFFGSPAISGSWGGGSDTFAFADPSTGWFTTEGGGATAAHSGAFGTHDGGQTWSEIELPPLPGLDPATKILANRPVTFADGHGVLLVAARSGGPSSLPDGALYVYATADGGLHWGNAAPLFPAGSPQAREHVRGTGVIAQFLDTQHWFVMNQTTQNAGAPGAPPTKFFTSLDGGAHWTTHANGPLIFHLQMLTPLVGWAEDARGQHNTNGLLRTTDGGAHWTAVRTPKM